MDQTTCQSGLNKVSPRNSSIVYPTALQLTLCFVVEENEWVLLGLKKRGFGMGKFNGFGGKVEPGETIPEAASREFTEECGLRASTFRQVGRLVFQFGEGFGYTTPSGNGTTAEPKEILDMHVFRAEEVTGRLFESDEMRPAWFRFKDLPFAKMWSDDRYWFDFFMADTPFFGHFIFADLERIARHEVRPCSGLVNDPSECWSLPWYELASICLSPPQPLLLRYQAFAVRELSDILTHKIPLKALFEQEEDEEEIEAPTPPPSPPPPPPSKFSQIFQKMQNLTCKIKPPTSLPKPSKPKLPVTDAKTTVAIPQATISSISLISNQMALLSRSIEKAANFSFARKRIERVRRPKSAIDLFRSTAQFFDSFNARQPATNKRPTPASSNATTHVKRSQIQSDLDSMSEETNSFKKLASATFRRKTKLFSGVKLLNCFFNQSISCYMFSRVPSLTVSRVRHRLGFTKKRFYYSKGTEPKDPFKLNTLREPPQPTTFEPDPPIWPLQLSVASLSALIVHCFLREEKMIDLKMKLPHPASIEPEGWTLDYDTFEWVKRPTEKEVKQPSKTSTTKTP